MSFISEEEYEKLKALDEKAEEKKEEARTSDNVEIKEALDLLESGAKLIITAIKKLRRI